MIEYNFEVCFICHYPTTDFERRNGGEPWCGACVQEEDAMNEEAVYYAMAEHWEEDMKEMLAGA
jgi:hypothetical protein